MIFCWIQSSFDPEALARMQELEDEADAVLADRISQSSRYSYRNSMIRFLKWMVQNKRDLIQDGFLHGLTLDSDGVPTTDSLHEALAQAPANRPIHFNRITGRDFMTWVLSMKTDEGKYFQFTTYANHRSAFACMFRDYSRTASEDLKQDLLNRFSGLKKRVAKQAGAGLSVVKVGKDPLPFSFFRRLAKQMMIGTSRDVIFARTFMLLSWNLMSRAANTVSVCFNHMEWGEDSMQVYFAHMKNDQGGSRPKDRRHVYANPLHPEICPILALGIYWATFGVDAANGSLFPGNNQYDRFRKILRRVLATPSMSDELAHRGTDADNIGMHSLRKGAATFFSPRGRQRVHQRLQSTCVLAGQREA